MNREHLYRRHLLPIQCNRCCATFANEPTLREHQRDPHGCDIKDQVPLEGFDKDQERKLKSKKRSLVYQSEEDKWKGVYRILFPDDNDVDMPSPCKCLSRVTPDTLLTGIKDIEYQPCTNGGPTGEPSNISRFQEFSRLELPRLVRRTLEVTVEEEAQPLEDRLKERLVDIVRDCQTQLISLFQSTLAQSKSSPALSLSQLRLPGSDTGTVEPSPPLVPTTVAVVQTTQQRPQQPSQTAPFHNFDSFPPPDTVDYIPIPTQYPEHEHIVAKHEASPPVEGGGSTPDSGYDSAWNTAPMPPPQESYLPGQGSFTQTLPFTHAPRMAQPQPQHQHQHQQQQHNQPQPSYNAGAMFVDSEYVDLGGYYGLFQSRNGGFDAGMLEPAWTYMDGAGADGMGQAHSHGHGRGNGAVM